MSTEADQNLNAFRGGLRRAQSSRAAGLPDEDAPASKREPCSSAAGRPLQQTSLPALTYEPTKTRPRSFRRWIVPLAAIALVALAIKILPGMAQRVHLLKLQKACLEDLAPPEQAVFDRRATALPNLKRSDPDFIVGADGGMTYVGRIPRAWQNYLTASGLAISKNFAVIFLHRLRAPNGNVRLIAIELDPYVSNAPVFDSRIFHLGTLWHLPVEINPKLLWSHPSGRWLVDGEVIFAGQPDASDASHFTFKVSGKNGTFLWEGWLQNDDTIKWKAHAYVFDVIPQSPPSPALSP